MLGKLYFISCNDFSFKTSFGGIGTPPPKKWRSPPAAGFRDVRSMPIAPALATLPWPHAVAATAYTAALANCFPPTPSGTPPLSQELPKHNEPCHDQPPTPSATGVGKR